MTLIKDLIQIPEHVATGDFVLRLSEGVTDPAGTVNHYMVTPQLAGCFDQALKLVRESLAGNTSKSAYLHGSFGSGKSHFMAVLHLLLQGDPHARAIPELAKVVSDHNGWVQGKRFLLVPYHLIGAKTLESAILGGYAAHVQRHFPGEPVPAVYRSKALLANAEQLREAMGNEKFLAKLNEVAKAASGGWGALAGGWTMESYQQALLAAPGTEECRKLVRDLVETHFPAMRNTEDYVDLDEGLSVISAHARAMGYQAVILFLDELILWLASHAAEPAFVSREGQKVVKLVESARASRPVPVVSFVARQRDLRELVGQHVTGSEKLAFADVLNHHEGRFSVIKLEDRNLPAIARKRILMPVSEDARRRMDEEFARTTTIREDVMKALLSLNANREDFRNLYPFSPALVETLVAVSSVLQRERTALKVMASLLVDQRETLSLGQIVPVGDLYDPVTQGDEAFSSDMRTHFANAQRLYLHHLRPLIEGEQKLSFADAALLPPDDPRRRALHNDDRLIKTLLLAALVPEVESLKNMTPARLAALNHGTIKSPIPGQEATTVLTKVRRWAAAVGHVKIREAPGSQITLGVQLSGVDAERILAQAESVDNPGNRIRKLKEMIFEQLGLPGQDDLFVRHAFRWKGTDRVCDVVFSNIRDLPDDSFRAQGDAWKIIIDYPFDQAGHSVRHDLERVERFRTEGEPARTLCWVPSFLGAEALAALGRFVRLEQVLKENQFPNYVQHLNAVERDSARAQLESQRDQLKAQLIAQLEAAYSLRAGEPGVLDPANSLDASDQFQSLDPSFKPQAPVAANMRDGLAGLLNQALRCQFPAHPTFEEDASLTKGTLMKVLEVLKAAAQTREPSILVEQTLRKPVARIAGPLKLGEMHDNRFQQGAHWHTHFTRQQGLASTPMSVGNLRRWMDAPLAMGLPAPVQDLIILAYASRTNRVFRLHGGPVGMVEIGSLRDEMVLEEVSMPQEGIWSAACDKAKAIFGLDASPLLNAANLAALADALGARTREYAAQADTLVNQLARAKEALLPEAAACPRWSTALEAQSLLKNLSQASGASIVNALASFTPKAGTPSGIGASIKGAARVGLALEAPDWKIFHGIRALTDGRAAEAAAIWKELVDTFCADEYVASLPPKLTHLKGRAVDLLTVKAPPTVIPPPPPTPPVALAPQTPVTVSPTPAAEGHLRKLYSASQVRGDSVPDWLKDGGEILVEQVIGNTRILVTPTMGSIIRSDPNARIDMGAKVLHLPRYAQKLALHVVSGHPG